jgi:hypothetical protein
MNWKGIENGELLALAANEGFDAILTKDAGIAYEQNLTTLPCALLVIRAPSNSIRDIQPLVPEILAALATLQPKTVVRVG